MSAASLRATEILRRLPQGRVYGAELGVWDGTLSQLLLLRDDLVLLMVDSWAPKGARPQSYLDSGDVKALSSDEQMAQAHRQAIASTGFANYRAQIVRGDSAQTAEKVADGTLDFVFIDADHSYEGVCRDIQAWLPKVKSGGWIGGHDYGDPAFPGVERAVDVFFGSDIETGANFTWFHPC